MAMEHILNGVRVVSLASAGDAVRANIAPDLGGIVSSLLLPGPDGRPRECLYRHEWFWEPDTPHTRGGIPLLFPVCGRLLKDGTPGLYHVGDRPFVLPIHGFAMRRPWEVVDASRPDELRLRLADSGETRARYPFAFELELRYAVSAAGLSCRLTVTNPGDEPLPYHAGFHPYFLTPVPGSGKEQTRFSVPAAARLVYNETKTDVAGTAPPPAFPLSVAHDDINGLLLEVGGPGPSRLLFPDGFEIRQTASELMRCRQCYTLPGEPFFCDEPWMAPPGALNRPGTARRLPPGQAESCEIRIAATTA